MLVTVSIIFAVSLVGVFAHWLKGWLREEITSNFIWYMVEEPKHTGAMLFTLVTTLITLYQTHAIIGLDEQSLTIAFMTGFTADSSVNKEG
jgi:hypothetical protein